MCTTFVLGDNLSDSMELDNNTDDFDLFEYITKQPTDVSLASPQLSQIDYLVQSQGLANLSSILAYEDQSIEFVLFVQLFRRSEQYDNYQSLEIPWNDDSLAQINQSSNIDIAESQTTDECNACL